MIFVASVGRSSHCNRCRAEIHPSAPHRKGQHTPAVWCQPCAETLFGPEAVAKTLMGGLDKRRVAEAFPEFTAAMRALKARAVGKRTVVIGGEE